ncbi:MFS monocarboxylate transporter [Fomitopsis serialis]|uniref:MFS monocarboxylate transporter n=1 Tax=Fomitopsis serialis TaxID=139415 RepID=UPI002008908D|nr:MFS monocarboxylate transporter [Neoantrodia serialis]KAH9915854.1 MFS monocarboxylate transporter [Neoantrodia serialis]
MSLLPQQRAQAPDGSSKEELAEQKNAAQVQLAAQPPPAITFPDGGLRAWGNVTGCFLLAFTSFGQLNAFGVFQTYYAEELLRDYTLSTISWIGSVQLVITYMSGIVLGRVFDIYGARSSLVIGWILSTFSLMMTSLSRKYYQVMLAQGIGLGIGIALQFYPIMTVPTHWFRAKRSAAMGIVVSGASLSGIIYPIMLSRLFDSVGFPWAVRITAFMNFGIQAVAIPLVKERLPHRLDLPLVDYRAFREGTFLLHIIGGFLVPFGLYTPYWYIELFGLSIGLSANLSFYMIAIMNAAGLIGRVVTGYLSDMYGRFNVTVPILVLGAISSMAIWTTSRGAAETVIFSVIFGFTSAAYSSISASATAQITPDPTQIGARIGMFMCVFHLKARQDVHLMSDVTRTAMAPGILTGPSIAGAILQRDGGNYLGLEIFVGVMLLAAAAAELAARLYGAPQLLCKF